MNMRKPKANSGSPHTLRDVRSTPKPDVAFLHWHLQTWEKMKMVHSCVCCSQAHVWREFCAHTRMHIVVVLPHICACALHICVCMWCVLGRLAEPERGVFTWLSGLADRQETPLRRRRKCCPSGTYSPADHRLRAEGNPEAFGGLWRILWPYFQDQIFLATTFLFLIKRRQTLVDSGIEKKQLPAEGSHTSGPIAS